MNIFQEREQIIEDLLNAYASGDNQKAFNMLYKLNENCGNPHISVEPERGFYTTADDGRLLLKDQDDDWSFRTHCDNCVEHAWIDGSSYAKWPTVCDTLPQSAFPLKRVNADEEDDDDE